MRSPFHSEQEAFRFVLLLALALIAVALAATLGPTWLAIAVLAVVLGAVAGRLVQVRMRKLRGLERPVKMAPPHLGSAAERRVLVVANDTLIEAALLSEVERLASVPLTHVFLLVPALISPAARLTGGVDSVSRGGARPPEDGPRSRWQQPPGSGRGLRSRPSRKPSRMRSPPSCRMKSSSPLAGSAPTVGSSRGSRVSCVSGLPYRFAISSSRPAPPRRSRTADTEARYRHEFGDAAARKFGLKALAGAGILAAVVISMIALAQSSERQEARAASQFAAEQAAALPPVAKTVALSVVPEYKRGPEGEKHDAFTTTEFAVRAGQPQQLKIDNTDDVPHSITSPEANVKIVVMPGTHTYTLLVKQPGRYLWFCTFVCDEWAMQHTGYMSGYITAI